MTRRHILGLVVLALVLGGCWVDVLANPTDPAFDSLQVTAAYQTQGDLSLALMIGCAAVVGGLAMWLFAGLGGRR